MPAKKQAAGCGVHELRYTLSSLPILPGVYTWRIDIFDSGERVDDWECIPQMQVVTVPLNQTRDEIAGILNIPSELNVRIVEETRPMHPVTSADLGAN
jgi:hypothetical protein